MRKRCLCLVLCLLISLLCFPTAVPAEDISGTAVPVAAVDGLGSFATVSEAVDAISSSGGTGTVHLLSDCVLPETGDDFPRMVWGMLFAVGTAALTGMAVCGKKKDIDS